MVAGSAPSATETGKRSPGCAERIRLPTGDFPALTREVSRVFAEVVEGMDVVDKIKGVSTGRSGMHQDVPKEDVVITSVTVSE
jgi:cyclophilin family peptidyl-prolyl cis-trans isomerase